MRLISLEGLAIFMMLPLLGCSSSNGNRSPDAESAAGLGGGAGGGIAGTAGGSAGTGGTSSDASVQACNTLTTIGDYVTQAAGSGPYPTPAGGAILDGTYVLTKIEIYPPLTVDPSYREKVTMSIAGNQGEEIDSHGLTYSYTYSTSGSTWTTTVACPYVGTSSIPYTATADTVLSIAADGTWVNTYTKQ